MKITHIPNTKPVTVDTVIVYEPWPFNDRQVHLTKDVGYITEDGEFLFGDSGPFNLVRDDDNVLAMLSDGRKVVSSREGIQQYWRIHNQEGAAL